MQGQGAVSQIETNTVVIASAAVSGVFQYKAGTTPGPGNPPVGWWISSSAGPNKDPFGNTLNPSSTNDLVITDATGGTGQIVQLSGGKLKQGVSSDFAIGSIGAISGEWQVTGPLVTNTDTPAAFVMDSIGSAAGNHVTPQIKFLNGTRLQSSGGPLPVFGGVTATSGNFDAGTAGQGFRAAEGANAKQGTATLAAGTVTVANTSVTANSRIFLTPQDNNTAGALRVSARVVGTSFTITSSNAADTGVVAFEIFEPG